MYKRFHGSSFLSDFTLSIEFEGASTLYHALAGQASQQGLDQLPMSGNEAFSTPVSSPRSGPQPGDTLTCSISVRSGPSAAPPGLSPSCTLEHTTAYPSQHLQQQQLQQQRGPSACGDTATPTPTTSSVACTLPVHGVVLAAASSYFETLLKNWTGESDRTIHMCVGEEQLQAAKALISFMYQVTTGVLAAAAAEEQQQQQQKTTRSSSRSSSRSSHCVCCCRCMAMLDSACTACCTAVATTVKLA